MPLSLTRDTHAIVSPAPLVPSEVDKPTPLGFGRPPLVASIPSGNGLKQYFFFGDTSTQFGGAVNRAQVKILEKPFRGEHPS